MLNIYVIEQPAIYFKLYKSSNYFIREKPTFRFQLSQNTFAPARKKNNSFTFYKEKYKKKTHARRVAAYDTVGKSAS